MAHEPVSKNVNIWDIRQAFPVVINQISLINRWLIKLSRNLGIIGLASHGPHGYNIEHIVVGIKSYYTTIDICLIAICWEIIQSLKRKQNGHQH